MEDIRSSGKFVGCIVKLFLLLVPTVIAIVWVSSNGKESKDTGSEDVELLEEVQEDDGSSIFSPFQSNDAEVTEESTVKESSVSDEEKQVVKVIDESPIIHEEPDDDFRDE